MTNAFHWPAGAGNVETRQDEVETLVWWQRLPLMAIVFSILAVAVILALNIPNARDYVGADNDDGMRLVEVRDLLAGQGWFDMMQYRLGLNGGTLMHWSRVIDAPIAGLILLFGLFTDAHRAEVLAVTIWPLLFVPLLIVAVGLGARRLGGYAAMNIAMALTGLLVISTNKFLPGAIDHHNAQLVLVAGLAAVLLDSRYGATNYAVGGVLAAIAIAIGAETTPLIAAACLGVTALWVYHGSAFRPAAMAYGLALAIAVSVLFFATVPPSRYSAVTCDSLSLGFYALATLGGLGMALTARYGSEWTLKGRLAAAGANGAVVLVAAVIIAPKCLGNPLADLDPLLVTLWLDKIVEAQSIFSEIRSEPATLGGFYATGFFAIAVSVMRILRDDRREGHAVLLLLLLMAWGIALVQVRGAVFANMLAIVPLSLMIAELRRIANAEPQNIAAGAIFFAVTLASVPSAWVVAGVAPTEGAKGILNSIQGIRSTDTDEDGVAAPSCTTETAVSGLVDLPAGVVVASNSVGVPLLRFTNHSVLTAPYHRNQAGMLTELHIGLASAREAMAFLRGSKASYLAYCATDTQTREITKLAPNGLYADLAVNRLPSYLRPLPKVPGSGLRLFKVIETEASGG